jgi:hypothetical protein
MTDSNKQMRKQMAVRLHGGTQEEMIHYSDLHSNKLSCCCNMETSRGTMMMMMMMMMITTTTTTTHTIQDINSYYI